MVLEDASLSENTNDNAANNKKETSESQQASKRPSNFCATQYSEFHGLFFCCFAAFSGRRRFKFHSEYNGSNSPERREEKTVLEQILG